MSRPGINYQDVKNAVESLLTRGLSPTIQRIRETLGSGSNTTISQHFKRWQQERAAEPLTILPPSVPETVMQAAGILWENALQHAEAAFDEQRAAANQATAVAEQAREQALANAVQAQQTAAAAQRHQQQLEVQISESNDCLLLEQERRTVAEASIAVAEQHTAHALAAMEQIRGETAARVRQFEATLERVRSDLEQEKIEGKQRLEAERQRGEANETRWLQQIDRIRQESRSERQSFNVERQDWKNREAVAQKQQETLRQENLTLRTSNAAVQERHETSIREINELKAAAQQWEMRYLDALRTAEVLRAELHAVQVECQRLQQLLPQNAPPPTSFGVAEPNC